MSTYKPLKIARLSDERFQQLVDAAVNGEAPFEDMRAGLAFVQAVERYNELAEDSLAQLAIDFMADEYENDPIGVADWIAQGGEETEAVCNALAERRTIK